MTKRTFLFLSVFILFFSCTKNKQEKLENFKVKDDLGNSISFSKPPQRIITLAPNLTEMIYDLDLGKNLVGNTTYCDYPAAARNVDKVGDMLTFNFEKIVTLKPDIVFITVEGNTKETYEKFGELGIKNFCFESA
ncbi:MAG: ABC transporter substrate-binding protein, partial [Bacteroidetes bacterium]|nr:ABC transporter substrate-binding protein [Bacteroidota bacterium]